MSRDRINRQELIQALANGLETDLVGSETASVSAPDPIICAQSPDRWDSALKCIHGDLV